MHQKRDPSAGSQHTPPEGEQSGISYPKSIDLVSTSKDGREVHLWISEFGEWTGAVGELRALQSKVENYLTFALDGQLEKRFPESKGKKVAITLHTFGPLSATIVEFLRRIEMAIGEHGFRFELLLDERPQEGG